MIAGVKAADQFVGLDIGSTLKIRGSEWKIVGLFEADGSIYESEVWVDATVLSANLKRGGGYSSMFVQLESAMDLDVLNKALDDDPQLELEAVSEAKYYSEQSEGLTNLINQFGYGVAMIMAVGAIFGALNTMYAAVSTRSVEIATLRALGFGPMPVVVSVLMESLVLALIGGLIGGAIAYIMFNGYTASTMSQETFSQVSFSFSVTDELLLKGIIWSCALGVIGGLFPAVNAARQPITVVLRGL
jgi:putative ABC transport system permease protein